MKKIIQFAISFFFLSELILPKIAFSQKYSLQDCYNLAMEKNYDIILANYQKQFAKANKKSAFGSYLPNVNFSAGYGRQLNNVVTPIEPNSFNAGAAANLLLFDGFAREANYDLANLQVEITDLQTKFLVEQIKNNIYLQFVEIMRLSEIIKVREEDIAAGKIELDNLKARFEAEVIPINSVLSQEAELGNKEITLLQSQIDVQLAKQNLAITLGLTPSQEIEFEDENIPKIANQNDINNFRNQIGSLNSQLELAFKNRIDYSVYNLKKESAILSKKAASAEYFPTLSTSLGYNWQNSVIKDFNSGIASFGINLNIPIFNNFNTDLRQQQAELNFQQENTELLKSEQNIRAEVQTAYFNLESAEKSVNISEKTIIAAKQNFDAVKERFDLGSATITDYITANLQYITSQLNNISASYIYLKSKQNLLFLTGQTF